MLFALRPVVLPIWEENIDLLSKEFLNHLEKLNLLKNLCSSSLSEEAFLSIIHQLYYCRFPGKDAFIAHMLGVPKVKHQRINLRVNKIPNSSCEVDLYSKTGDYGNAIVPDMPTFKSMVTGENISNAPCIITGWSNSEIGNKLLDSKDMNENLILWNMFCKLYPELTDIEYYKDLLVSMIKKEFTRERIAKDIIDYINTLKQYGGAMRMMISARKLTVDSEIIALQGLENTISDFENSASGRKA